VTLVQKKGGADHKEVYAMKVLEEDFNYDVTELLVFGMIGNKNIPFLVNLHYHILNAFCQQLAHWFYCASTRRVSAPRGRHRWLL
jgi:hypothetical protein